MKQQARRIIQKQKIAKHGSRIDAKLVACDVKDRSRQAKTAENLK